MSRFSVQLRHLAAQGRRWFAKPPTGFEIPPESAIEEVSVYASLLFESELGLHLKNKHAGLPEPERSTRFAYIYLIQSWIRQNGPTIFVDPEILSACENTDALGTVEGSDVRTVYPCGYISLPKDRGFRSKQFNDRLAHIWFRILEPNEEHVVIFNGQKLTLRAEGRRLFMQGYWDKSTDCSSFSFPLDSKGSLINVLEDTRKKLTHGYVERTSNEQSLREEAYELGEWLGSLGINLLLIMQSYPKYLDKLAQNNSKRQSFSDRPEPSSILIRRSTARPIHQVVSSRSESSIVTGKGVSEHWRRGHWRRQPHGEDWEIRNPEVSVISLDNGRRAHMKWISAVYIGLDREEEVTHEN